MLGIMERAASTRAAAGALYLDRKHPGWYQTINEEKLDIRLSGSCALAHLYGTYEDGQRQLGLKASEVAVLGFFAPAMERLFGMYRHLTAAWKNEIRLRRVSSPLSYA